jgi:glycerol-3-phosphate acyltransferase PlsX
MAILEKILLLKLSFNISDISLAVPSEVLSAMLKDHENINYVGYVEGNDIFSAKADVIVCDGFTGNIALKTSEGTAKLISEILKESFNNNIFSKIAMLLSRSILLKIKNKLNINKYNGASLLGLKGIVIKSHGHSSSEAFETAIFKAIKEIKYNIPEEIELRFKNTESLASKAEL